MSDERMVTIEVDGKEIKAPAGAMLIDVTDEAGISVPRFCYHKKLSISANCRMCLVEVENVPKPLPACATPVNEGMKVQTRSPRALAAQKGTMEFLLINHPLDCPICDQGGECELQDVALGYGGDVSRYSETKRVVPNPDLGPLISTDMTRCIHCTRCVRFGSEIAGIRELGATGRGEHMTIGTYIEHSVDSELSGNVIDLCPVGALTSKPFRYKARAWELIQTDGIAPHDSVGSNIYIHVRNNRVMRVHPKDNETINESWISDRDRFSYEGLYSDDRLQTPMVKDQGEWREASWDEALEIVAKGLKQAGDQLGTLVSSNCTLEELYLAQQVSRGLGSQNIDHRLRQNDFRSQADDSLIPWLGCQIADLENLDAILLIGSVVRKEQPILGHRIRKAVLNGAAVTYVNPMAVDLNYEATQFVSAPSHLVDELASIAKAVGVTADGDLGTAISAAEVSDAHNASAQTLSDSSNGMVFLGNLAVAHPDYSLLQSLAAAISDKAGLKLGYLPEASNSVGARLAGVHPQADASGAMISSPGQTAGEMLTKGAKTFLLVGLDSADCWDPVQAQAAFNKAELVVAMTVYQTPALSDAADVLLPMAGYAETSGTYVNAEGTWQAHRGAVTPLGDARPGWKILRVLGNLLELDQFEYNSSEEIRDELKAQCVNPLPENKVSMTGADRSLKVKGLERIGDVPIYAQDALVRRAASLQKTSDAIVASVSINAAEAGRLGLSEAEEAVIDVHEGKITLPLIIDSGIPDGCVRMPAGVPGSDALGGQYGDVTLVKV